MSGEERSHQAPGAQTLVVRFVQVIYNYTTPVFQSAGRPGTSCGNELVTVKPRGGVESAVNRLFKEA